MELHGGKISVHSEGECMGSTFRLEIPMTTTMLSHERPDDDCTNGATYHSNDKLTASPRKSALSSVKEEGDEQKQEHALIDDLKLGIYACESLNSSIKTCSTGSTSTDRVTIHDIQKRLNDISSENVSIASGKCSIFDVETSNSIRNMKVSNYLPMQKETIISKTPLRTKRQLSPLALTSSFSVTQQMPRTLQTSLQLLIVDDSAMNRKMLRRLMEVQGHCCEEAADGQIAVDMVIQKSNQMESFNGTKIDCNFFYDAILMDSVMPNMNGPTATTEIRKLGYTGPIIGVTGNALAEDQQAFIEMGASKVFTKPINVALITDAFKGMLK